ncbi:hypothetical protein ACO1O0_008412 [Amphichorda felina]
MVVPWQPSTGSDQTMEYEQEVENFLSSGQTTREAIQAGLEFLRARYEIRQPHSLTPEQIEAEIERRIATAKEALKKIREDSEQMNNDEAREQLRSFHLNSMQFAVFMIAPLGDLKSFVRDSEVLQGKFLNQPNEGAKTKGIMGAVKSSQGKKRKSGTGNNDDTGDGGGEDSDDDGDPSWQPSPKGRSRDKDVARDREGSMCVITQSPDPEVCHIWPFVPTKTQDGVDRTRRILMNSLMAFGGDLRSKLLKLIVPIDGELAASDRAWNMIPMRKDIHNHWGKAYFGLKWIGEQTPRDEAGLTTVKVQWHWLPSRLVDKLRRHDLPKCLPVPKEQKPNDAKRLINLDDEDATGLIRQAMVRIIREPNAVSRLPTAVSASTATVRDQSGHLVQSGRIFILKVQADDLDKTQAVIEAQWLAIQMAALSGAGEVADDLDINPPPSMMQYAKPVTNPTETDTDTD